MPTQFTFNLALQCVVILFVNRMASLTELMPNQMNEYGEIRPREVSRCSIVPRPTTTVSRRQTRYRRLHPLPVDPSFTLVPRTRLSLSTLSAESARAEATPSGRHRSRSEQALEEEERRKLGPIIEWLKGASNGSHS